MAPELGTPRQRGEARDRLERDERVLEHSDVPPNLVEDHVQCRELALRLGDR